MNVLNLSDPRVFQDAEQADMLGGGLEKLCTFAESAAALRTALETLVSLGDENTERRAERMMRQLETFEPSVTMIGQIKSGKTSLVNALIGAPDLLPADVNPWTSVVTSLHLHPEDPGFENSASFRFFDEDEWDRLISGGGRIGELASRAGADEELEKIKEQVAAMREKSRVRLGRRFEVMLGQQRDYGYFDKELIERYVCLGEDLDETEDAAADTQGRFADITKSADINMQRAGLPMRLCLRDTPGVNDTFMMREQITIRAIRDSRICVVVLSAHQALSSTDMALIRLISNVKSRDVIIFVNRIDELSDPASQIPQITQSISETLKKHKGPAEAEVIFGSALWASYALQTHLEALPTSSIRALQNLMQADAEAPSGVDAATTWRLSGVPALQDAIAERIVQGSGAATLQRIGSSAKNLAAGLAAADRIGAMDASLRTTTALTSAEAHELMDQLCARHKAALASEFDALLAAFAERMERVQDSFLERATASLVEHLDLYGAQGAWSYDPAGLRVLLSASHKVLARKSQSAFEQATKAAAAEITDIYGRAFSLAAGDFGIALPRAPQVPDPVSLGRTIALDLTGGWWKRWWMQRRGHKAYASSFYDLIKSETTPVIADLRDDLAQTVRDNACARFDAFLKEQLAVFASLDRMQQASPEELSKYVAKHTPRDRRVLLEETLATLEEYATS
ncbi:dynamin family protein [Roseobacter weihaiensis]|uniref:dynamin family protein n=1 Tax=Roseobacter weihaiensis TaxID=2763262 RepID=UPI001D0B35A3|nr:dynamin family protein [Roseobacter sp. H9]